MNYVEIMKSYIEDYGLKEFTHKTIIELTNTNCPHSVLRQLKKYYEIDYIVETKNFKKFRKYTILKRKEDNVKKSSVWRESQKRNNEII